MSEFKLIAQHFSRHRQARSGIALSVGDDAALLTPPAGAQLAISTDALVCGTHFFADVPAHTLGHKALAVNLSDLAAMGATPLAFTLALSLPQVEHDWLAAFAQGLYSLADAYDCALIGGDTTRGPLAMTLTVLGQNTASQPAMLRSSARAGDDLYISADAQSALGQARAGLEVLRGQLHLPAAERALALERLQRPTPRVALGQALARLQAQNAAAISAIDVSDGLIADLGHLCAASGVAAVLDEAALLALAQQVPILPQLPAAARLGFMLAGGDDYELLFTAAPALNAAVEEAARAAGCRVHRIGRITSARAAEADAADEAVQVQNLHGQLHPASAWHNFAWQHFD